MDQYYELQQVTREYDEGSFFSKIEVDKNELQIDLTTLECEHYIVKVCENGWYTNTSTQYFPTFESLANHISPQFQQQWLIRVNGKLHAI
ncbi:hypothetical protein KL942_001881 [Ogataea angusta]|uniref:GSKIP domain-containing protein n=1 Tax=Pichia angusta TaxID=870730 RepID=A0ABQ7RXX4_PICAN|nr:hypothetical protein KL942_001881 [Ogataea angusta]KAG7849956.1 hypothetical protein KL940_002324 [Ogataea angusta]